MTMYEKRQILVSLLIVNYRSLDELRMSLRDLNKIITKNSVEVLIANNDKQPLPIDVKNIASNAACTKIFQMPKNRGFGSANNHIANAARGTFLFFLNPDTYNYTGSIDSLIKKIDNKQCDVIAPRVNNADGSRQRWSYGKKITPQGIILDNIRDVLGLDKSTEEDGMLHKRKSVDWVTGAAFMIKKDDFLQMGGFDEDFFLYFEDIDLCRRIKMSGKKILVSDDMSLKHSSGASAKNTTTQKKHYYEAQDHYVKKYYGTALSKAFSTVRGLTHSL